MSQPNEPILNVPPVVVVVLAVLGLVHGVREWFLDDSTDQLLVWTLAFVPARYDTNMLSGVLLPGGWGADIWTFFSYALVHADWTHIGFNAVWLLAFASPVARRFGAVRFLLFLAVTVAGGAVVYLAAHSGEIAPMVGASAGISGMMGAAARFAFEPGGSLGGSFGGWGGDRGDADRVPAASLSMAFRNPRVMAFVGVWFALNLLFGLGSLSIAGTGNQQVAWEAHVGGFLAGLLLFAYFDPVVRAPLMPERPSDTSGDGPTLH